MKQLLFDSLSPGSISTETSGFEQVIWRLSSIGELPGQLHLRDTSGRGFRQQPSPGPFSAPCLEEQGRPGRQFHSLFASLEL